jgi:hypothetical protein
MRSLVLSTAKPVAVALARPKHWFGTFTREDQPQ